MTPSSASGSTGGQDAAHGRLAWWLVGAAQWVAAHSQRGKDRLGRVHRPLPDRCQGPGAGQHGLQDPPARDRTDCSAVPDQIQ
jgi:hypothetical protein